MSQHDFTNDPNFKSLEEIETKEPGERKFEVTARRDIEASEVWQCPGLPKPGSLWERPDGNFLMIEMRTELELPLDERLWIVTCTYRKPAPTKCLVVENQPLADLIQRKLGDDWHVIGFGAAIHGMHFDLILVSNYAQRKCEENGGITACWLNHLLTRLCDKKTSRILYI